MRPAQSISLEGSHTFSKLLVTGIVFPPAHRARLAPYFKEIYLYAKYTDVPDSKELAEADIIYGFPPKSLTSLKQVPKLQFIQLASAGSEQVLESPLWEDDKAQNIALATASGVHTGPIPQYFICTLLALYSKLQEQILITQNEKRWGNAEEIAGNQMFVQELRGKTVGILGYGHIGRESARLAAAFGAKIVAANTSGKRTPQDGYIIPGTGDPDGSIPEEYYTTKDNESFAQFLSRSDVVLLSLPSTSATRKILSAETFPLLKPSAIIINIGRGDAVDTDALVSALDSGKLAGAAIDVADPEPLSTGHTLYGRKNVILTPHLSGRTVKYWDLSLDIFLENLQRWKKGEPLLNQVDTKRGY